MAVGDRTFVVDFDDAYGTSLGDTFEPGLVSTLTHATPAGSVALDVGANIGLTTMLLAQIASRVHAFEAVPSTFRILETNISRAGLGNATLHPFGLGDRIDEVVMTRDSNNRAGAFVGAPELPHGHEAERADIRTLDSLTEVLGAAPIGLIKIDVEGYELHVLRGGKALLATHRPVVVLEMNHWCLNAFQRTSVPDFLDALRATFPVLYAIDDATLEVRDLHIPSHSYDVMHEHIVHFRYMTILGCFSPEQASPALVANEKRRNARAETDTPVAARSLRGVARRAAARLNSR